jgi:hypothetical protein
MLKPRRIVSFWFALSALVLWSVAATSARAQAEHLAGLWHLDGNLLDASGNGNNGTLQGGATFTNNFKFGESGSPGAISLDGVSGYIDIPNSPSLNITNQITVEAWVKMPDYDEGKMDVVSKGYFQSSFALGTSSLSSADCINAGPGPHAFMFVVTTGYLVQAHQVCGDSVLTLGAWHHLVGTYDADSGDISVYVDGVLDGDSPLGGYGSLRESDEDVQIGNAPGASAFFQGSIDEVRIWNRVLSPQEIMASAQAGLRAVWHFDENSGTTTADASGYGNAGTIHDASWEPASPAPSFFSHLTFDGSDDYVAVPNSTSLSLLKSISVEARINETSEDGKQHELVVSKGSDQMAFALGTVDAFYCIDHPQPPGPHAFLRVSTPYYEAPVPGVYEVTQACGATALTLGSWHHLLGTYDEDSGALKIYVDGALDGTEGALGPLRKNDDDVQIGTAPGTGAYFHGSIDEVRIWARPLSPEEVAFLAGASTRGEIFGPTFLSQTLGSGAVFTPEWHVGTTPADTKTIVLSFIVPDDQGTTMATVATKNKNYSTPVAGAELVGSQNGTTGLWTLITAVREDERAHTLHLQTPLNNSGNGNLGMNEQWSPPLGLIRWGWGRRDNLR